MAIATHRTPISILQEVCVKKGITPSYELISSEGPIHEPNYVFLCTAGPFSATSKGSSKKKAKHQASYLILLQMLSTSNLPECDKATLRDLHYNAAQLLGTDFLDSLAATEPSLAAYRKHRDDESNFVGQLQEVCQKNMWPPPTYEFLSACEPMREYQCRVKIWQWECEGRGASKKLAKRNAAEKLLNRIVVQKLTIPPEALESMEEENLALLDKSAKEVVAPGVKAEPLTESRLAAKSLRWLCDANGNHVRLTDLQSPGDDVDYCAYLEDVAKAAKISIVYTYESNTKSGSVYALIQLSTTPPHVIKGTAASSIEEARRSAAVRAVLFIKSMSCTQPQLDYMHWLKPFDRTNVFAES